MLVKKDKKFYKRNFLRLIFSSSLGSIAFFPFWLKLYIWLYMCQSFIKTWHFAEVFGQVFICLGINLTFEFVHSWKFPQDHFAFVSSDKKNSGKVTPMSK